MQQWNDNAIILSSSKYGETSSIISLLTEQHGLYKGLVRGVSNKKNRGIFQPGNAVEATWKARLPEHLGTVSAELTTSYAAILMMDASKLAALSSLCAMCEALLPERDPCSLIYQQVHALLTLLQHGQHIDWPLQYVRIELLLLAHGGFGLDLTECAATGCTENLLYVSPKSGRAVSREAGEPYKEKLLPLPSFLLKMAENKPISGEDIAKGLALTGFFLDKYNFAPYGKTLPAARERLVQCFSEVTIA